MLSYFRRAEPQRQPQTPAVPVQIQIRTEVVTDEGLYSHGAHSPTSPSGSPPLPSQPPPYSTTNRYISSAMSLPRVNYDPRRVCLNPFPEFTLGKHRRTVGVYLAGALVRFLPFSTSATSFDHPPSSRLLIGRSWTQLCSPRTQKLPTVHRQILTHRSMSPSSTGSQASAHYSGTW